MEPTYQYVWLNLNDGTFSSCWGQKDQDRLLQDGSRLTEAAKSGWKLIKFACVNDKDFQFTNHMKLR